MLASTVGLALLSGNHLLNAKPDPFTRPTHDNRYNRWYLPANHPGR